MFVCEETTYRLLGSCVISNFLLDNHVGDINHVVKLIMHILVINMLCALRNGWDIDYWDFMSWEFLKSKSCDYQLEP